MDKDSLPVEKKKKSYPETRVISGFMELLPEEQIEFDKIKKNILDTFESFGFTALDTPIIERLEVLYAKDEGDRDVGENATLVYEIAPRGEEKERKNGLRFDLTVPLARYVAEHFNSLAFPFRRCHIAKVYRGERAQKGRFREFYQCDVDIIGHDSLSIRYDAEIPSIIFKLFKKLDFGKFTIRVNNRKLLNGLVESLKCTATIEQVLSIIDRIEKISQQEFTEQLNNIGLTSKMIDLLTRFFNIKGSNIEVLQQLKNFGINNDNYSTGLYELTTVVEFMQALEVDENYYRIDPIVVRGMNYYTGTVYETILDDYPEIGSVCGGGRFDDLAKKYTKEYLPGVGISIGLTRLFDKLKEIGLIKCIKKTIADVIIVPMNDIDISSALNIGQILRLSNFNVDVLLEPFNIKKKFTYVNRKDTPYTVVVDHENSHNVILQYKNSDGTISKQTIPQTDIIKTINNIII